MHSTITPQKRSWYTTQKDEFLGTDILLWGKPLP